MFTYRHALLMETALCTTMHGWHPIMDDHPFGTVLYVRGQSIGPAIG